MMIARNMHVNEQMWMWQRQRRKEAEKKEKYGTSKKKCKKALSVRVSLGVIVCAPTEGDFVTMSFFSFILFFVIRVAA